MVRVACGVGLEVDDRPFSRSQVLHSERVLALLFLYITLLIGHTLRDPCRAIVPNVVPRRESTGAASAGATGAKGARCWGRDRPWAFQFGDVALEWSHSFRYFDRN